MAGTYVRDVNGTGRQAPQRPVRVDSRPSKHDSFSSEDDSDEDASSAQAGRRSYMPPVHSAASSKTVAYRGGPSLQRFSAANQREVEERSSSGVLAKVGKAMSAATGGGGGKKVAGPDASGAYPKGTCDKCDGPHLTDACPIYKKKRDDHPDAWRNFGRKTPLGMGKGGGNFKLKSAKVIRQPGDGNCLFHSMSYGLGNTNANKLRREIADFIRANPDLEIAETPMRDWVKWDSGTSVSEYARRMAISGWGGEPCSACLLHAETVAAKMRL
eukprot:Tamp_07661.p1 GENE.Tamp_07661~~Tamp_07661.p1  ORF type:complete len:271 (+),score=56.37 Tamp_07661:968-1780(+)